MNNPSFTLDTATIQQMIEQVVQDNILSVADKMLEDPVWLEKVERMINQAVVQKTVAKIASTDINSVIYQRVDENLAKTHEKFMRNFSSNGITDQATQTQLTIMDDATVVENELVVKDIKVMGNSCVKDLTVLGSINTDNQSWKELSKEIARLTLQQVSKEWQTNLINQVREQISSQGIDFSSVKVGNEPLVDGNKLSNGITETNIQRVGHLKNLTVKGDTHLNDTVSVVNRRLGVNTANPECALSVWDEEVCVIVGKFQSKQAFVGTSRDQSLVLGTNRQAQLEIDSNGLTRVKRLQVGLHKIGHENQVPGWSGTRGDLILNSNPGPDRVFAWVCLGAHKWQSLKSAE